MKDDQKPKPQLVAAPNGPLIYITDFTRRQVQGLVGEDGRTYSHPHTVALCRCGASENKPLCDGSHGAIRFNERKETDGHLDKRKNYEAGRIIIHDNRGVCSHSRACVEGLPKVFDPDRRPWIDPGAATVEEIIATVNKCPSGALSYSLDGIEHRDQDREPKVVVSHDGPLCVQGGVELMINEPRAQEVSTEHCTLCRCGSSKNKPFCDGAHRDIGFSDP
jgi:CDGSH-type Zn-finger protein